MAFYETTYTARQRSPPSLPSSYGVSPRSVSFGRAPSAVALAPQNSNPTRDEVWQSLAVLFVHFFFTGCQLSSAKNTEFHGASRVAVLSCLTQTRKISYHLLVWAWSLGFRPIASLHSWSPMITHACWPNNLSKPFQLVVVKKQVIKQSKENTSEYQLVYTPQDKFTWSCQQQSAQAIFDDITIPAKHKINNSPLTCAIIHRIHKCSCRSKQVIPKISSKTWLRHAETHFLAMSCPRPRKSSIWIHLASWMLTLWKQTTQFQHLDPLHTVWTHRFLDPITCCKERRCSCWIPPLKKNCAEAPHPCLRCCHIWAPLANAQTLRGHKMKPTKLQKQKRPQSPGLPGDQRPRGRQILRAQIQDKTRLFFASANKVTIFSVIRDWRQRIWTKN